MGIKERKERERKNRNQQIIVSARRLFNKNGFDKTTMVDIASEAELSIGALYLYFKSKEDLYASLSIRTLQYFNIGIQQIVVDTQKGLDPFDSLDALFTEMLDLYDSDHLSLVRVAKLHSSYMLDKLSHSVLSEIDALIEKVIDNIASIIEVGIRKKIFVDKPQVILSEMLWSIFTGAVLWEYRMTTLDRNDYPKQIIRNGFEMFKIGIDVKNSAEITEKPFMQLPLE